MPNNKENQEYGLPRSGHDTASGGPIVLGQGDYRYEVSGENWGQLPDGWYYREATAVAVDQQDNVYVFNRGTCPVVVFDTDGNMVDSWGQGIFKNPHGISVGPDGNLFCVDSGDSTVRKFTPGGELIMTLGEANRPSEPMSGIPFSAPTHVATDPVSGEIYIADGYANACVHKFSPDGKFMFSWGQSGTDEGQFNIVHNIATDSSGQVYVADRENHRIQIFGPEGEYRTQWVNLSRAAAIYIDIRGEQDLVYIGEYFAGIGTNHMGTRLGPRVTVMSTSGQVVGRAGTESYGSQPGRFFSPHGIAVDSRGDIYVAEVAHSDYGRGWNVPEELRSMQKLARIRSRE
jgi:DNA-binding beta-propeller fold protein YncE